MSRDVSGTARVVPSPVAGGALRGLRREGHAQHLGGGGDIGLKWSIDAVVGAVDAADLRGRGGAWFPVATKIEAVAASGGRRILVANGEEGEPASVKDRYLMRARPHLVLEGVLLAARAARADRTIVYASDPPSIASLRAAVVERGIDVEVFAAAPGFVAGEETAVVRAIDGGPAKPTAKPPRPYSRGVEGHPTLVLNVESLARIALLTRGRRADLLVTLSGAGIRPVLTEVTPGTPLASLADRFGVGPVRGFLAGGFSGGLLPRSAASVPLHDGALRRFGSMLGCAAFVALGADDCPVAAAADVLAFFDRSNAGQCGSCVKGTAAMAAVVAELGRGVADPERIDRLARWARQLPGRGACGALDAATLTAGSLLRNFPDEIAQHLRAPCPRCARLPVRPDTRFRVHPPDMES